MRTTIHIDDDIWLRLRVEVETRRLAGEKATMGGILTKLLREAMARLAKKP